jgi:hypothetical protein
MGGAEDIILIKKKNKTRKNLDVHWGLNCDFSRGFFYKILSGTVERYMPLAARVGPEKMHRSVAQIGCSVAQIGCNIAQLNAA